MYCAKVLGNKFATSDDGTGFNESRSHEDIDDTLLYKPFFRSEVCSDLPSVVARYMESYRGKEVVELLLRDP